MSERYQVAFQGGGAKLGVLIAAAEAVYAQRVANGFTITRVSGTSAGAIVACMLATGENPAIFRKQLSLLASKHLDSICTRQGTFRMFQRIWQGTPLYHAGLYKTFLRQLFTHETQKWPTLNSLRFDIFIHAIDIHTGKEVLYKKGESDVAIEDALFASSALPFIFRTYKDVSGVIDGGLTNNFPSDILHEGVPEHGPIMGFSFAPNEVRYDFPDGIHGVVAFSGKLISTMIDTATTKALAKLPVGDVHYFSTKTSTLDWKQGLDDLEGANFTRYFEETQRFVDDVVTRYRMSTSIVSREEISKRIIDLHEALSDQQGRLKVKRVTVVYTSNSLRDHDPKRVDQVQQTVEIASVSDPVFTFGVRITSGGEFQSGDPLITVFDEAEIPVAVSVIPIAPDVLDGKVPDNNFLLFFHRPLVPGKTYKIYMAAETSEVMYDLRLPNGQDTVAYLLRNMDQVEEVNVLVLLPTWVPRPSLVQGTSPLPSGMSWNSGSPLDNTVLARLCPAQVGFYLIGWRSENVVRGMATGFTAVRMPLN